MRKTKKQLLGFAGLAAVGLMTAIAYCLPAPNAAASNSQSINVNVTVYADNTSVVITNPQDGSATATSPTAITVSYSNADQLDYKLTYVAPDGQTQEYTLPSYEPAEQNGTHTLELDLNQYGGYGDYVLTVIASKNSGTPHEDSIAFSYQPAVVEDTGTNDKGNPTIDIEPSAEADKVEIQVYDKDGNPIFVDKDGNETPLVVDPDDVDPETGKINVTLPMADYDAPEGQYTGVVITYDENGDILGQYTFDFYYKPLPKTPDTGSVFANLNIARADYIATGLIVFGLIAGFAVFLATRKSHRR